MDKELISYRSRYLSCSCYSLSCCTDLF